jgi:hypothetical protein
MPHDRSCRASWDRIQHFADFERQALGREGLLQK